MTQHKRQRVFAMLTALSLFFCNSGVFSGTFAEGNTGEERRVQLICGKEEHIHSEACYEKALICGEEEKEAATERVFRSNFKVHHHKDSCYDGSGNLTCGLIEDEYYHTHNEYCKDAEGNLVCGLGTRRPHEHTAECYQTERKLICGLEETEEHIHSDACYETTETLICDKPTTKHQHTEECYNAEGKVICGKMEVPTFTSTEENWAEEVISEGHTHTEACYEERLSCGMEEHTHTEECYEEVRDEEPTEEEPVKEPEEEIKEEEAPAGEQAEETEEEETTEENGEELTEEPPEETTGESAEEVTEESGEETKEEPEEESSEETTEEIEEETTEETTKESAEEVTEESGEETKEEPEEEPGKEPTEELTEEPSEEPAEEPTEEELTEEPMEETGEEQNEEPAEEIGETLSEEPEEESGEEPTEEQSEEPEEEPAEEPVEEPTEELTEEATEETTKEADEKQNEEIAEEEKTEENEEGRIESGDTAAYRVVISFHKDAGIPEGTEVTVNEADGNGAKGVQNEEPVRGMLKSSAKMRMSAKAAPIEEAHANIASLTTWRTEEAAPEIILYQKTLDISLVADGEEIEPDPEAKITVTVELPGIEDGQEIEVRHITEKGSELLESRNEGGSITFETDSFSLFEFTAKAQAIGTWTSNLLENTFFGKTNTQETSHSEITVSDVTEGLTVLEAFTVTRGNNLWMTLQRIKDLMPGKLESIVLYTVENGKLGAIVKENITLSDVLRFSISDLSSFALVKDSGLRRKTAEMGNVLLNGMMPKNANVFAEDVQNAYEDYQPEKADDTDDNTEIKVVAAYDISIQNGNEEYQPDSEHPIAVEIDCDGIKDGQKIELWHIIDDENCEKITDFVVNEGKIKFEATGFSTYIITEEVKLTETVQASDGNTYEITVTYQNTAGIPMEGTALKVREILPEQAGYEFYLQESVTAAGTDTDHIGMIHPFDIKIVDAADQTKEYEPTGEVSVSIRLIGETLTDYADIHVTHFTEDDKVSAVDASVAGDRVEFTTESFSVYVVTGDVHLLTYRFYTLDEYQDYVEYILYNDQGKDVTTQRIKNGEKPVAPQSPVNPLNPNATFAGWYENTSGEASHIIPGPDPYDFDNILPITRDAELKLYAKFITSAYVIFHGQYDSATQSFPVMYTRRADVTCQAGQTEGSAQIIINDLSVPYNGTGNTMVFSGWSETSITVPGSELNDGGSPVSAIETETITIKEGQTIHLYPIFENVYWLSFYSGPTGSGATYYPETYYFNGDGPENLSDHLPTRDPEKETKIPYSFDGWYADTRLDENGEAETDAPAKKIANADGSLINGTSAEGISITNGKIKLTANVMLYAGWSAENTAKYTVVIVKQKASDDDGIPDKNKKYEYSESFTNTGTINATIARDSSYDNLNTATGYNTVHPDSTITNDTDSPYYGYSINETNSDSSVKIAADGSGVLYVRYDWENKPDMTGKTFKLTFADSQTITGMASTTLPKIYSQIPYGTELAEYIPANPKCPKTAAYEFGGWYADANCTTRAFFTQEEYDGYSGSKALFETMPGADLTVYAGWELCWYVVTIDPNYGAMYTYNSNHQLEGTGSTWFWSAYGGKIQEYSTVTREYVESDSGTWYYVNHAGDGAGNTIWPDRYTYYTEDPSEATEFSTFAPDEEEKKVYRYAGWYEVKPDGSEEPYDFNTIVDHNITLKLHWTKTGVFYLDYNPVGTDEDGNEIKGTLNKEDENEKLYLELDGDAYNDDADVVVTRTAIPPKGYEFAGWKIRNSDNKKIYRPGEVYRLLSKDAATVQGKRRVYLDAVYSRVPTASIAYHANGGTVDEENIDLGSPAPQHEYNSSTETLTISNLVNNSDVTLSDGGRWLSRTDARFAGWCSKPVYDPEDPEAPLLDPLSPSGTFRVDNRKPEDLYAIWAVDAEFHLNKDTSTASLGDWGPGYTINAEGDTYTQEAYLGNTIKRPEINPTCTDPTLMFREWRTVQIQDNMATDDETVYDFTETVNGKLQLYAYWTSAIPVEVKAFDASSEGTSEKPEWITADSLALGSDAVELTETEAAKHTDVPSGYQYAFAAAHEVNSATAITEKEKITSIRYIPSEREAYVTYSDGSEAPLDNRTVCFVYYQQKTINISYVTMAEDGKLTAVSELDTNAPNQAADLGQYDAAGNISLPQTWTNKAGIYYSYAIGSLNAYDASDLTLITQSTNSEADGSRPSLTIENTWRGFRYSTTDGESWTNCGYDNLALYVVYYPSQPAIVTFSEKTIGFAEDTAKKFTFDYKIESVDKADGTVIDTIYDDSFAGYEPIQLSNGQNYSAILFTDQNTTQRITVTQSEDADFTTTVTPNGNNNVYTYTADGFGIKQEALFTNTHKAVDVELHVAQVRVTDGMLLLQDGWCSSGENSFKIRPGEEAVITNKLPSDTLISGQDNYGFGAVFCGTDGGADGTAIIPNIEGGFTAVSIAFEPTENGSTIYDLYLKDSKGKRLITPGDDRIYYLYYPKLTVYYVLEADNGDLTQIEGAESGKITYAGKELTLNGKAVVQGQKVDMPLDGLTISQDVGSIYFNIPPLLDNGTHQHDLVYTKIGATPQETTDCECQNTSDLNHPPEAAISENLILYMKVIDNKLQWRFLEEPWTEIDDWPVIYAIYRERGYELDITKTMPIDTGYREPFTITVSSTAINREKYKVEGTGYTEIIATLEQGQPGKITFPVEDGSIIKLFGLGPGNYTITETDNTNYILQATKGSGDNPPSIAVADNSTISLTLDDSETINLINNTKPICRIGNSYFHSISSAVQYIIDYSANFTETIEMIADYELPSSDMVDIPTFCNITLATAASDQHKTCGETAVITRRDTFTNGEMFSNMGTFTIKNVTIDGGNVPTESSMIDNKGTLNISTGSTLQNANCTTDGGAVYSWQGTVNINGGTITHCNAKGNGGAIYVAEHAGNMVEISSGTLSHNSAELGGAIYYRGIEGSVTVSGGIAEENAATDGGAIYMESGSALITGGTIQNNDASGSGAAVYAENAWVTIENGDITGNNAGKNGGAVYMKTLTLTMNGGNITGNTAGENGGAFWGGIGAVVISGGTVSTNEARNNGGAVYSNSSSVTISGGSIEDNTADENGGAIYSNTGILTVTNGSITNNTATNGNGGGICSDTGAMTVSGTMTGNSAGTNGGAIWTGSLQAELNNCTLTGSEATNGAAVFANAGSITFNNGSVTGNTGRSGGAIGIGGTDAWLFFSGNINVTGNYIGTGETPEECNVYLDQDADTIINVDTLNSSAKIGVYVADGNPVFENHGVPSAKFGSFSNQDVSAMFKNDRTVNIKAKADSASKKLIWIRDFEVKVYYIASYGSGLPYKVTGNPPSTPITTINETPPSNENVISEIADDVREKGNISPATAVFGTAYRAGSVSGYEDYITNVNWSTSNNRWEFVKADGTTVYGGTSVDDYSTLIFIYTEPYYLSIENNTTSALMISSLMVKVNGNNQSIIAGTGEAGYGYVYAENEVVQSTLHPVNDNDPDDGFDGLVIGAGESIKILVPGGKNMPITLTGVFENASGPVTYTQTGLPSGGSIEETAATTGFTLNEGSMPTTSGKTSEIIFGGEKDVCRIVVDEPISNADPTLFIRQGAGSGQTQGQWEYAFKTPERAVTFIKTYNSNFTEDGKLTAKIEMTADYMITEADRIQLMTDTSLQYDITFKTAVTGTFQYPGTEPARRATISRATNNKKTFIEAASGNNQSILRISDIDFDGKNYSGSFDGGIVKTVDWNVAIDNASFSNSIANNGGGIYIDFTPTEASVGSLTINNTSFRSLESKSTSNRQGGGAIWTRAEKMTLTGCSFTNCRGKDQGGAVFHRIDTSKCDNNNPACKFAKASTSIFTGCTFENCQSRSGGAVESDAHHISFTECTFTNCYAIKQDGLNKEGSGGAISTYIYEKASYVSFGTEHQTELIVTGCYFDHCNTSNESTGNNKAGHGGAIRSHSFDTIITNSTFKYCRARQTGGAISVNNGINDNNTAYKSQGKLILNGCEILDCTSDTSYGGAVYSHALETTVGSYNGKRTEIRNCTASKDGGGIYHNRTNSTLTIQDTDIIDCTANAGDSGNNHGGGGIYTNAKTVTFNDSTIKNCGTPKRGGGVYIATGATGTVTLDQTTIQKNRAKEGAGLYISQSGGTLDILNSSVFDQNTTSSGSGGGVYTDSTYVNVRYSEFFNNTTNGGGNGGAICQDLSGSTGNADAMLVLEESRIHDNIADIKGGGIFTEGSMTLKGKTSITNNKIYSDTATNAAGVYLFDGVNLIIGDANSDEENTVLYIQDNSTTGGKASDLRLPEAENVNENRVIVYCGISGEIRVVNAKIRGQQFGTATGCTSPIGFSDSSHVFVSENLEDPLYGIVDRTDATNTHIIWGGEPICKITDGNGRLLYLDSRQTRPAVFDKLDVGDLDTTTPISAFSTFRGNNKLYYGNGVEYTGDTYQVKMLVENYTLDKFITTKENPNRTIILTTAGSNDSLYPYRGRRGTRCTITRGEEKSNMITAKVNLTLQNIVLDGGCLREGYVPGYESRIIFAKGNANINIVIGRNTTLQNATIVSSDSGGNSPGNGAGVCITNNSNLSIEGGSIRNCTAVKGGAVYKEGTGYMNMSAGIITNCTATGEGSTDGGGGIYIKKGSIAITGGNISRCKAKNGGGIYLDNDSSKVKMEMSGGTITGNNATAKGGGIAVGGGNPRIYFADAPYIYGNTCDASVASNKACNVEMDQDLDNNNNPTNAIIISKGLIGGAMIGVYVPGEDGVSSSNPSKYDKYGAELDRFARFEGDPTRADEYGLNYFVNDRNGMKGGQYEPPAEGDQKIYWRIIYALSVSKQVLSDEGADLNKEFDFTLTLDGYSTNASAGRVIPPHTSARLINGWFGDLYFTNGVAHFKLKNGETKTADLLPLGFDYTVTENLGTDAGRFKTTSVNDTGTEGQETATGHMTNGQKYTYKVSFSNLSAVCKIMDPDYGLLYTLNASTLEYEPEVYSNLAKAFNKVNAGDSREWYYFDGETYHRTYPDEYRIEMLIPNYDMDYPESLASLINGKKVTLTTADRDADDGFPYTGTGSAKIIRAVTGESMFTVSGELILDNIQLDGGKGGNFTCNDNGGIVQVKNGGKLTIGTGVSLENSTTQRNGAGIYLAEGSKLYISGNPVFNGNTINASSIASEKNGGESSYSDGTARQDIYIAGYDGTNAESIVVTGNLTGAAGSIWVWAEDKPHYHQRKQFAIMAGGKRTGLYVFRNARTNTDTLNNTDPLNYLYGEAITGDNANIYWSGSPIVTITKKLNYPQSSGKLTFNFEATLYKPDGTTIVPNCIVADHLKTDQAGKVTFSLKAAHDDTILSSIELFIPKDYQLKVGEISLPPPGIYNTMIDGTEDDDKFTTVMVNTDRTIAFVNSRNDSDKVVLTISKAVAGAVEPEDLTHPFPFEITLASGTEYELVRYTRGNSESAWIEVENSDTTGTVDSGGKISFTLCNNQRILLLIPKDIAVTVSEESGDLDPSYTYTLDDETHSGDTLTINQLKNDIDIEFVNTRAAKIVAPTSFNIRHTPWLLLLLLGSMIFIGGAGFRRKSCKNDDGPDEGDNKRAKQRMRRSGGGDAG